MGKDMSRRHAHQHGLGPHRGFTVIELMVTVAVMAILAAIAAPSMTGLINSSRLSGQAGELTSALQLARSEAIRRNSQVTVCPSSDGTSCAASTAWTRWIVLGAANTLDGAEVIRDNTAAASLQVSGPSAGIIFRPSGLIDAQQALTVCMPTTKPVENRQVITVMISGSTNIAKVNGGGSCP